MKRFARNCMLTLMALSSVACVKQMEQNTLKERVELTITAVREGYSQDTKTTRQEDGSVIWNPLDEISFFFGKGTDGGSRFTAQNSEDSAIAEFRGYVEGASGGGEDYIGSNYFWGVYPYSSANNCDGESVTTRLTAFQTARAGSFARNLFPTIARSKGLEMAFYNVCGGVKFKVSRDDITSVRFKGNADEPLAGTVKVAFNEQGKPEVKEVVDGKKEVTLYAPGGGTFEVGKYYFIVLLPTELSAGFTMTFQTKDSQQGTYVKSDAVSVPRSTFGVLDEPDKEVSDWADIPLTPGGGNSGIYLGIMGFNDDLYPYPISLLNQETRDGFNAFIESLDMNNKGTILYYAVDQAITTLQSTTFPEDLFNVAIVTFTDGLDQGSHMKNSTYGTDDAYLNAIQNRYKKETVSGQAISAYAIGLRGSDVTNATTFSNNLKSLASSPNNAYEVTDMDQLNATFQDVADQLEQTSYVQKITVRIPGQANGTKVRFTLDNITSVNNSKVYIEGVYDLTNHSLTNIIYKGLTGRTKETVVGVVDGINVTFTFQGLRVEDNTMIAKEYIQQWNYVSGNWQKNSEFDSDENGDIVNEKHSAAIMLLLDCSGSLGADFNTMKEHAKSFVTTLSEPQPEVEPDDPEHYPSDHYSTKPLDLSLAVVRDSVRYYVTQQEYATLNRDAYIIEGLAIVTGGQQFIMALQNEPVDNINWDLAMQYYGDQLPNYDQGVVISAKMSLIQNALNEFGGRGFDKYYEQNGYGIWTSYSEKSDSGTQYGYVTKSGGIISFTSDVNSKRPVRLVYPIDEGEKIQIHTKDKRDLTLAVTNGTNRLFIDYGTFTTNGIPDGYVAEGLAIVTGGQQFIMALQNEPVDNINWDLAMQYYGDQLPNYDQGVVISAKMSLIQKALNNFGGRSFDYYWEGNGYGIWTSYSEKSDSGTQYGYVTKSGGIISYTSDVNSTRPVRLIVGTFE